MPLVNTMQKKSLCFLITLQFLIISITPTDNKPPDDVCETATCREAAEQIIENMDLTVDPCDNFYQFVCGKFLNTTILPDNKDFIDYYTKLEDKTRKDLRMSFEASSFPNEPRFSKLAKVLYKSCMNTDNTFGTKSRDLILEHLKNAGGWPILEGDNWNETNFDWIKSTYYLSDMGYNVDYFMKLRTNTNPKNITRNVIDLRTDISRIADIAHYFDYVKYLNDIAQSFGADPIRAHSEIKNIILFEIMLLENFYVVKKLENETSKLVEDPPTLFDIEIDTEIVTIEEMSKQFPSINWKEYIGRIFMSIVEIQDDDLVYGDISYMSGQLELMNNTSKRTIANYLMFKIIRESAEFLDEEIRNQTEKLNKIVDFETEKISARWEGCVNYVRNSFDIGAGALYVRNHLEKGKREDTLKIAKIIQEQFIKNLERTEWMDKETKKNAIEKAAAMIKLIAYPDEFLNDTKLDEYYKDLVLSHDNYLQAHLNLTTFNRKKSYQQFRQTFDKEEWFNYVHTTVANAFNIVSKNTIFIPAVLLQGMFINNDRPRYTDYATIGALIGHEIVHGFDVTGSQIDKNGNVWNWWNSATAQVFINKTKCLINQYYEFTAELINKTEKKTLEDDIADNGGFRVAYMAYKNWAISNKVEPRLPGLSYTPSQMFWIYAASMFCKKYQPEKLKMYASADHSLSEFRIIGSFSNIPEFSKDFNCPSDSQMNRRNKCTLWNEFGMTMNDFAIDSSKGPSISLVKLLLFLSIFACFILIM